MPERNENYMSNIKRLCGFCINEWHLTTMVLPYVSKEIDNNFYKIIDVFCGKEIVSYLKFTQFSRIFSRIITEEIYTP